MRGSIKHHSDRIRGTCSDMTLKMSGVFIYLLCRYTLQVCTNVSLLSFY